MFLNGRNLQKILLKPFTVLLVTTLQTEYIFHQKMNLI